MSRAFPTYAERPDEGNTIRNPSVALLCVDSYDMFQAPYESANRSKRTFQTPYISLIYKKQSLAAGHINRVALTEVNFNWAIPTINDKNNKFNVSVVVSDGGAPPILDIVVVEATIPIGWYNFTDLAAALQTALNAAIPVGTLTGVFTVTVDPATFFYTITYTVGAGPNEAGGALTPDVLTTELSIMLGFEGSNFIPTNQFATTSVSVVGNFPRLTYTPYIDIVSQRLTKNQHIYDNSSSESSPVRSLLARIYLSNNGIDVRPDEDFVIGARPFTIKEMYNFPKQISWEPTENIDSIDLLVNDWNGEQLYSQNVFESSTGVAPVLTRTLTTGNAATFQLTLQLSEN